MAKQKYEKISKKLGALPTVNTSGFFHAAQDHCLLSGCGCAGFSGTGVVVVAKASEKIMEEITALWEEENCKE